MRLREVILPLSFRKVFLLMCVTFSLFFLILFPFLRDSLQAMEQRGLCTYEANFEAGVVDTNLHLQMILPHMVRFYGTGPFNAFLILCLFVPAVSTLLMRRSDLMVLFLGPILILFSMRLTVSEEVPGQSCVGHNQTEQKTFSRVE